MCGQSPCLASLILYLLLPRPHDQCSAHTQWPTVPSWPGLRRGLHNSAVYLKDNRQPLWAPSFIAPIPSVGRTLTSPFRYPPYIEISYGQNPFYLSSLLSRLYFCWKLLLYLIQHLSYCGTLHRESSLLRCDFFKVRKSVFSPIWSWMKDSANDRKHRRKQSDVK